MRGLYSIDLAFGILLLLLFLSTLPLGPVEETLPEAMPYFLESLEAGGYLVEGIDDPRTLQHHFEFFDKVHDGEVCYWAMLYDSRGEEFWSHPLFNCDEKPAPGAALIERFVVFKEEIFTYRVFYWRRHSRLH